MTGVVFGHTLRQNWRSVLYWGLGLAFLGFYVVVVFSDEEVAKGYASLLSIMPSALLDMLGATDLELMTTPEGFLNFAFFGYALYIFAAYAVVAGLNITANEEDDGIMDMLLSLPLPRWKLVLEKMAAYTILIVAVVVIAFLGIVIGQQVSSYDGLDLSRVLESSVNLIPVTLLMLAITVLATTIIRRKGTAIGIVVAFIVGSYFIDFLGRAASQTVVASLRAVSFISYYDNEGVMLNGLNFANIALLLAVTALLVAGSLFFFQRRDIGL
jgi:ABC-2 type transport system permease protein